MAFLENLGKKVGEAAQAAAKKSGELVETTKLNVNINSEEDKVQKLCTQIGRKVYEKYSAAGIADEDVKDMCEAIKVHEQNIKSLRDKIMEVKGVKTCANCGSEMDKAQLFCAKCGSRIEVPAPAAATYEPVAPMLSCPSCGTIQQAGSVFCANCGTKIG